MDVSNLFDSVMGDGPNPNKIRATNWNELVDALATAVPLDGSEPMTTLTLSNSNGATAAVVFEHDPTITGTVGIDPGEVGGTTFATTFVPTRFTNGPGGEPIYMDDSWHIGQNVGTLAGGVGRADTGKPNLVLSWESKFYAGAVFGQEFHLQGVQADGATTFRPWSFFISHDNTVIEGAAQCDTFRFNDKSGNNLVTISDANNALDVNAAKLRFTTNNVQAIQQKNSSGAMIDLLYLSAGDVSLMSTPFYASAARAGAGAPIPGAFAVFQPTTANSGDYGVIVQAPTFTGHMYGFLVTGSVTGQLQSGVINNAVNVGAHAKEFLQTSGATGGDAFINFNISGVTDWSIGCDNSDSDIFVFSAASSLGSSNALGLTTAGDVRIYKALVALGGGAAPTLGTIGGSGPATAAQNTWLRLLDSTGAAFWVPAWK